MLLLTPAFLEELSISEWLPLAMFVLVSSITPGPNNLMLTAAGAHFGYRRSLPHMLGICLGGAGMLLLVGAGVGALFVRFPLLSVLLQWGATGYLLWLAWKIATADAVAADGISAKPMGFWQAAAFQWVNPKAWWMAMGIVAAYISPEGDGHSLLGAALVMAMINFPCISVWTLFGTLIGRTLRARCARHCFNWAMAGLLLASLYPMLLH